MNFLNVEDLSILQSHLSNLTGLYISVFGERGNVIIPPLNENDLLLSIRSSKNGRDDIENFIRINIEKILFRNEILIEKGPAEEYHFFIPMRLDNCTIVIVGGGVYISKDDFDRFCSNGYKKYGLSTEIISTLNKEEILTNHDKFLNAARHIQSVFYLILKSSFKNSLTEKRYRIIKTFLSLISDIKPDDNLLKIYDVLFDITMFFYNAEGLILFSRGEKGFFAEKVLSKEKERFKALILQPKGLLLELIEKKKAISIDSLMDILQIGLPDDVTNVNLFPIVIQDKVKKIFCILNSEFIKEDEEIIFELCKASGFISEFSKLKEMYSLYLSEKDIIQKAFECLVPLKEAERLYETIIDTTVELTRAEKASLMVSENGSSGLTIKAARGINKKLFNQIKIMAGEGIAGQVYQRGEPIVVKVKDDEVKYPLSKRTKYKTSSFVSLPLKVGNDIFGVLNVADKIDGTNFTDSDIILLNAFSMFASLAIERANYHSLAGHLKELSITDSLTGLFNRRYFEERFLEEIHRSQRHNLKFSLAIMDIDDFKQFNDTEGHLAGDDILRYIANISKDCLRVSDVIARFGGEEFAVIMPQTGKEEAFLVAERIRNSIKDQIPNIWKKYPNKYITITIGVATFPEDGNNRKELIRNADRALYKGKIEGKDRTIIFGKE